MSDDIIFNAIFHFTAMQPGMPGMQGMPPMGRGAPPPMQGPPPGMMRGGNVNFVLSISSE